MAWYIDASKGNKKFRIIGIISIILMIIMCGVGIAVQDNRPNGKTSDVSITAVSMSTGTSIGNDEARLTIEITNKNKKHTLDSCCFTIAIKSKNGKYSHEFNVGSENSMVSVGLAAGKKEDTVVTLRCEKNDPLLTYVYDDLEFTITVNGAKFDGKEAKKK